MRAQATSRFAGPRVIAAAALAALVTLTTGATAFHRGLFQDDAQTLFRTFIAGDRFADRAVVPIGTPTRRLQSLPYAVALGSGEPLQVLRVVNEVLLLVIAVMAGRIGRDLVGLSRPGAFLAAALTATATSDWLTGSMVAIGYNMAIALYLAGVVGYVRWVASGRWAWLAAGVTAANASLWTVDVAAVAVVVSPVLVAALCPRPVDARRLAIGALLWWGSAIPYYVAFAAFLMDTTGYAAVAFVAGGPLERVYRVAALVGLNFTPWTWAFARPAWFAATGAVTPWPVAVAAALAGAGVVVTAVRALGTSSPPSRAVRATALLLLMTIAANAPYAAVHLAEVHYRTQLLSRVWASAAVAVLVCALWSRGGLQRAAAAAAAMVFVICGVLGGIERQDYFRGYWSRHRAELSSLAAVLPLRAPGATLVLRRPQSPLYAATEAPYLARAWVTILAADPAMECRVVLLAPDRGTSCRATAEALICSGDASPRCTDHVDAAMRIPYDALVVLTYTPATATYAVNGQLPPDLTPAEQAAQAQAAYRPHQWSRDRRPTALARRVLDLGRP